MNLDQAANLAVASIINDGCSDITSESIEIELIKEFKDEFIDDIKAKLKRGAIDDMEFRPIQYLLTPKNRYVFDFRKAAIINPNCLAKYTTLVFQYADEVEKSRISISNKTVFSYRFKPDGKYIFDQGINYSAWRERTKELALEKSCKFIVSCDIAAFYDRINIHRIESTLLSIGIDEKLVNYTNDLLLFWSKKDSYGIPVGNIASRILAEVALIDIDQFLISENIKFTRYVDDYRLFAPDLLCAQKWMNKLTNRLFRDGLMLNTAKTNIREAVKEQDPEIQKHPEDSDKNSAEKVLKVISRLTGGYNRIVRRFFMPAEEKHAQFQSINISDELMILTDQTIVEFEGIQKVVVAALIQKSFNKLIEIAKICSIYLYGLDYFIDMLLKNHEFIPQKEKQEISEFYKTLIMKAEFYSFEWHCASIAKLLSHKEYFQKKALIHLVKSPGKDVSTYASMIALEGLCDNLTRSEFITIREYFDRSDEWEKRRLVWLSRTLPKAERKAWAKAIKATVKNDLLCRLYVDSIIKDKAI
ncbi:RNA-directed DNA polymerase [candidate division KSB1 bacterium]|nr:RNA-directed DNA polymerase [candidate division KSB1 bacterium]